MEGITCYGFEIDRIHKKSLLFFRYGVCHGIATRIRQICGIFPVAETCSEIPVLIIKCYSLSIGVDDLCQIPRRALPHRAVLLPDVYRHVECEFISALPTKCVSDTILSYQCER